MSLQSRLEAFAAAVGADIKTLQGAAGSSYPFARERQAGTIGVTTGSAADRLYLPGVLADAPAVGTAAPSIGFLRALPYYTGRGGTLASLLLNVTTAGASGSVARLGVWTNMGSGSLYPNTLLYDSGAIGTASAGVKTVSPALSLPPDSLLWITNNFGTAAPTVRSFANSGAWPILGMDAAMSVLGIGWEVAFTMAPLPTTFPTGGTVTTTASTQPVAMGMRIS